MLDRHHYARGRCLFVAAPDVVGRPLLEACACGVGVPYEIRHRRYPVAFVAQNGLTASKVPWRSIDCVFIGGTLECKPCGYVRPTSETGRRCPTCGARLHDWKIGPDAAHIVQRARLRGRWVHMGRVNTRRRLHYAAVIGVDSVDGSGFSKWPREMLERHGGLLRSLAEQRRLMLREVGA